MTAASSVLMIRPAAFGFNPQTAKSNAFQQPDDAVGSVATEKARSEFNRMVECLSTASVDVKVFDDLAAPVKPDAVFPNNWISMHPDGTVVIYPMLASNRRLEYRQDILDFLFDEYEVRKIIDLRVFEKENKFLEGTGSICFSHQNKKMFVSLSPRSHAEVALYLAEILEYELILFNAVGPDKKPVYHTNVMLNFCHEWAVICPDALINRKERENVKKIIHSCGYKILEINFQQMSSFCGNVLSLNNSKGEKVFLVSEQAYKHFTSQQTAVIKDEFDAIMVIPVTTIEKFGGGSVRCMMAENFLSKKNV